MLAVMRRPFNGDPIRCLAWPLNNHITGMDDRVRGQTRGVSFATGVRFKF